MHALRCSILLIAVVVALPSLVWAGDETRDLDALTTTSHPPKSSVTASPDDAVGSPESPDDELAQPESPDGLEESAESPDDPAAGHETPAPPKPLAKPASCKAPGGDDAWAACLEAARGQISSARQRVAATEAAYAQSVNFRDARGSARAKIIAERDQARSDLATAEERLPELVEEARRAGVSPRALGSYRD